MTCWTTALGLTYYVTKPVVEQRLCRKLVPMPLPHLTLAFSKTESARSQRNLSRPRTNWQQPDPCSNSFENSSEVMNLAIALQRLKCVDPELFGVVDAIVTVRLRRTDDGGTSASPFPEEAVRGQGT